LPALPETADELTAVQRLLGASPQQVLVASKATEEMLRSEDLGKYDVIHFATHGLLKGDILGLSEPALVLTPGSPSDSFDDGILTASEITRLSLNARLIVALNDGIFDAARFHVGKNNHVPLIVRPMSYLNEPVGLKATVADLNSTHGIAAPSHSWSLG
jgi:hypothetical protein